MPAEQSYHYTVQDIERYLNGNMTAQEMHDIERAALTDPLLADAIDGYRLANTAETTQHLNEIAALVKTNKKETAPVVAMPSKSKNWQRWGVAAVAMSVLGFSAWLMMRNSQNDQISGLAKNESVVVADSVTKNTAVADNLNSIVADTTSRIATSNLKAPDTNKAMAQVTQAPAPAVQKASVPLESENIVPAEKVGIQPKSEIPAVAENNPMFAAGQKREGFSANPTELFRKSPANRPSNSFPIPRSRGFSGASFSGRVTDDRGKPLPGASIFSDSFSTTTNLNGDFKFFVPGMKDSMTINVSALGYEQGIAMLTAGKDIGIALQPVQAKMDEIVVVGYGSQKKKAAVGSVKNLKADTLSTTVYPYPDGGWESFYDDLIAELGVNKSKADKLLHLKFMIENGVPSDFTIVKTPDMSIAERAIAAIKKGPRWKNFKNRAYAEVKLRVN